MPNAMPMSRPLSVALASAAAIAVCMGTAQQDAGPMIPELNMKVVRFAESHKGKQVGNGECWTLAAEALTAAGAQRPGADGVGLFDFGRKLGEKESPLPGDIVQFDKVAFGEKVSFPQHTAVVIGVDGKKIAVLHQNFAGKKSVEPWSFNVAERTEGTIVFSRPKARKPPAS